MTPEDVILGLAVAKKPIPMNAGQIADLSGVELDIAEEALKLAFHQGIITIPPGLPPAVPPEGRGKTTYIGVTSKALKYDKDRVKETNEGTGT